MNKILFSVIALLAVLSFASCKKCVTCEYTYQNYTYTSDEVCGKKKTLESQVERWETDYGYECTYH